MPRIIYLVTHGQKQKGTANPGLTPAGRRQTRHLRMKIPLKPHGVVCGTGRRHLETAEELRISPTRYSSVVGVADSKDKAGGKDIVILSDGTVVAYNLYTSVADRSEAFKTLVDDLPHKTVVVTSRSMIRSLGFNGDALPAAVYAYDPDRRKIEFIFSASEDAGDAGKEV